MKYSILFISDHGVMVSGKTRAMELLKKSGKYTPEARAAIGNLNSTGSMRTKAKGMIQNQQRIETNFGPWEDDETLPRGWKSRELKSDPNKRVIMSNWGGRFESKIKAYKYLCDNAEHV